MIRLLLVDDHTLLRETLAEVLEREPHLSVVGQAGDGDQAITLAARLRPDVVLLDLQMPGAAPETVVGQLTAAASRPYVIVLTSHDEPALLEQFLRLGVSGYLSKSVSRPHLVSVIRSTAGVRDDGRTVTVAVSRECLSSGLDREGPELTSRELEVVALAAHALSNRQIGHRLGIEEGTVKRHLRNAFRKLGAGSRVDAVNRAISARLIPPATGASR